MFQLGIAARKLFARRVAPAGPCRGPRAALAPLKFPTRIPGRLGVNDLRFITFHGIGRPERDLESGEAPYWIDAEQFRTILDQIASRRDRDRIGITFDDGNVSDVAVALPELARRQLRAQFFVLTRRLDQQGSLDCAAVRELARAGMHIGSHGVAHRDWSALTGPALVEELQSSRVVLREISLQPVRSVAIPFGRYNARVLRAMRAAGYDAAYSSDGGRAREGRFLRPRTSIQSDMSEAAVESVLSGQMPPMRRIRRFAGMTLRRFL